MELQTILTFVAVAALLVISPGPNGFLIAKTVPMFGRNAAFANISGFVAAFYVHGTLSIFGVSLLLVQSAQAFMVFKLLGAAYLIWIGIKALRSAFKQGQPIPGKGPKPAPRKASLRKAFFEGFLTNVLNPKVSMFYLAAFPQFMSLDQSPLTAYALVTAHAIVNVLWFVLMVMMLSRVKSMTQSERFKKWLNSFIGVVFIGFGSKLALMKSSG